MAVSLPPRAGSLSRGRSSALELNMSHEEFTPIESSLPKPWEQEETFNDVLYDWMGRAPWLAIGRDGVRGHNLERMAHEVFPKVTDQSIPDCCLHS